MRRVLLVLAATLVVAAGTGCASDDSDSAAPPAVTTSAETTTAAPEVETRPEPADDQSRWAKQVDAACKPWQERIDAVATPADASELEPYLAETLPLIRKQVAAVEAVKLPLNQDDGRQATLFVEGLRNLENALTRYAAGVRAANPEAAELALADANAAGLATRGYVADLGVTQCGGYDAG